MANEEKDSVEYYSLLKDFRAEIEVQEGAFSLCFWLYLMSSTAFPARLIQVCLKLPSSSFLLYFFLLLLGIRMNAHFSLLCFLWLLMVSWTFMMIDFCLFMFLVEFCSVFVFLYIWTI